MDASGAKSQSKSQANSSVFNPSHYTILLRLASISLEARRLMTSLAKVKTTESFGQFQCMYWRNGESIQQSVAKPIKISNLLAMDILCHILLALHCKQQTLEQIMWMINILYISTASVKDPTPTFQTECDYGCKGFADGFPTRRHFSWNYTSSKPDWKGKTLDQKQSIVSLLPVSLSHMLYWLNNKQTAVEIKCPTCGGIKFAFFSIFERGQKQHKAHFLCIIYFVAMYFAFPGKQKDL